MQRYRPLAVSLFLWIVSGVSSTNAADLLEQGFVHPPNSAEPRVWWHWMDGNVTEEGIRADLEWMHRVGIGGLQNFDAAFPTPSRIKSRLIYMTPQWWSAFKTTASTAARLGLEFSVAGSPGWSESGGPWVKPEEGMKKLVWREIYVEGGKPFTRRLPHPPRTIGPFQNVKIDRGEFLSGVPKIAPREVYGDIAVLAYRLPDADRSMVDFHPTVTSSAGDLEGDLLWDDDFDRAITIPYASAGHPAWVQIAFDKPQTIRAASLSLQGYTSTPAAELESSIYGQRFDKVTDFPEAGPRLTLAFSPVTARYFRLKLFTPTPPAYGALGSFFKVDQPAAHHLTEFVLHAGARVNRAEEKAAFGVAQSLDRAATPSVPVESTILKNDILDITSRLRADGTLDWTPPNGRWAILRLGYSLLGTVNHPASPEATGLEVDKLSRTHVLSNYRHYLDLFREVLGPNLMGRSGLKGMVNDSWEVGAQNWTEDLPAEFARRRGYELTPWLPALIGRVVDSAEATDRFLWDFRETLAEMVAENHYGVIAEELHRRGMIYYAEAHEVLRAFVADGMATKRFADVPMGAMWASGDWGPDTGDADIRESASVAHLYGRNLVAAESFTASDHTYAYTPEMLKPIADRELIQGVNRFVIHSSVHQPLEEPGPGFALGPFGQWFTRHETWAEQAGAWMSYLARSAYLMQQGQFTADVLYFYGEDSNVTALYGTGLPAIPEGFNFDFVDKEALGLLSVRDGKLVTASGMQYSVLVLDSRTRAMSLPVLRRLRDLVYAGATLIGAEPEATPSESDDVTAFHAIADALWGARGEGGERNVGKGRVVVCSTLAQGLTQLSIAPDFNYKSADTDAKIRFSHRRLSDGDLYFINNRSDRAERLEASFRVSGKVPELWHADTGRIEPVSYHIEPNRTSVSLEFNPMDAVFVIFRKRAAMLTRIVLPPRRTSLSTLSGPWGMDFSKDQVAPIHVSWGKLASWTESGDPDIKYYSGTVSYQHSVDVFPTWLSRGVRVELDLGTVKDIAEVRVNGRSLGVLWKAPFRIDVTGALHQGSNSIEVRVTNSWVNRLIGDKQPGVMPHANATFNPYNADSPLLPAGLLGPVTLQQIDSR